MNANPNIYHAVVFDLHPKMREFLDSLDHAGQIDRDEFNTPHVLSIEQPAGSVFRCIFLRNGRPENFVMHTRRKADAIRSWSDNDGYKRKEDTADKSSRKERDRRKMNAFECLVEQILRR